MVSTRCPSINVCPKLGCCPSYSLPPALGCWLPAVPGTHVCAHCRALVLALHAWNVSSRHLHGALPSSLEPSNMTWLGFSLSQIAIPPGHFLSPLCSITISPEHFVIMQHSTYLLGCLFIMLIVSLPTNRLVPQAEIYVLFYLIPRTVAAIECSIPICPRN